MITITLINKTPATAEFLSSLGISPAIIENVKEVQIQLEADTSSIIGNAEAKSKKINSIKQNG